MATDATAVLSSLKPVFSGIVERLDLAADSPTNYVLVTKSPSPFPQHKGHPMDFASLRIGKAYVSLHLMPLYMCPALQQRISPALKKRMQGKTCFHFSAIPDPELIAELRTLVAEAFEQWASRNWV